MNPLKKFLSASLALTMTLSLFSGCGAKPAAPETAPAETAAAQQASAARADALIGSLEQEVKRLVKLEAVDLHMYADDVRSADFSVMPESYDLRDRGFVPSVKSQGNWGTCWGFACTSAAEISALSEMGLTAEDYEKTAGMPMDLSEKHLAWFANGALPELEDYPEGQYPYPGLENHAGEGVHNPKEEIAGVNERYQSGGFMAYATGMYSAGVGPALESDYPYEAADGTDSTAEDWSLPEEARFDIALELENSYILPSPAGVDENGKYVYNEYGTYSIKNELLHGRAVSIAYHADQSMDPDAYVNRARDELKALGIPGTEEQFDTFITAFILGELTVGDLSMEDLAFSAKVLKVIRGEGTPQDAIAEVDAMTDEEIIDYFRGVASHQEAAVEEPEETEAAEETQETLAEEIDLQALAEKLGFDYDELLAEKERSDAANDDVYINVKTYAQYTNTQDAGANHAVTIVGWDDNYSVDNFLEDKQPPADGAWIVRNSWGEGYGNEGYFYLSYYDQTICLPESYDFVTSYKAGVPRSVSIVGMDYMTTGSYPSIHMEDACSYANIFTMDPGENVLRYVSVLCADLDTEVTAEVYLLNENAVVPTDGILLDRVVKDLRYGGYYRLPLSHDISIPDGSRIGVVVTQRIRTGENAEYAVPYAIAANQDLQRDIALLQNDGKISGTYGIGHIGQGESWVYQNGQWFDWADVIEDLKQTSELADYFSYDNLGIKVYAYSLAELEGLHQFKEGVSYHGMTMRECADCSYCVVHP